MKATALLDSKQKKLSDAFKVESGENSLELTVKVINIRENKKHKVLENCQVLKEYLKRKGSEVMNMLIAEYDYATDIRVQREEAEAIGREQGLRQGHEQGLQDAILELLEDYGEISNQLKQTILSQTNLDILKIWHKLAARSNSLEEFQEKIK